MVTRKHVFSIITTLFALRIRMESNKDEKKKLSVRIENIYPHAFWLEKYNKENKFKTSLFKNYLPNTRNEQFAAKFYSKYCEIDMTNQDYQKFIKLVENSYRNPKNCNTYPVCQNEEYGWISEPFTKLDSTDRMILMKPRCRAELSDFAEKLEEQKITTRPKFGGVIFKL